MSSQIEDEPAANPRLEEVLIRPIDISSVDVLETTYFGGELGHVEVQIHFISGRPPVNITLSGVDYQALCERIPGSLRLPHYR